MIVLFWRPNAPDDERLSPLHRVLWYNARWVWTKGDALPRLDRPHARHELIGEAFMFTKVEGREGAHRLRAWVCFGGGWPITALLSLGLGLVICLRDWVRSKGAHR